jgi:hypothetical protein
MPWVLTDVSVTAGHPPLPVIALLEEETVFPVLIMGSQQQPREGMLVFLP